MSNEDKEKTQTEPKEPAPQTQEPIILPKPNEGETVTKGG